MTYVPDLITVTPPAPTLQEAFTTVNENLTAIADEFAIYDFRATEVSGGGAGALDAIDGDELTDGDTALVVEGNNPARIRRYVLDADNGGTESIPYLIAPDTNPGDKRWVLASTLPHVWIGAGVPTVNDDETTGAAQGNLWVYSGRAWVCLDASTGAAVWLEILPIGTTTGTAGDGGVLDSLGTTVSTHVAAASPHSGHATVSDLNAHTGAANPHSGSASTTDLNAHTSAASPHTGHATLSGGLVVASELGSGTPDLFNSLRGDRAWAEPAVDEVDLKLVYSSDTKLVHKFEKSNHLTRWDGSRWITCPLLIEAEAANDVLDLDSAALVADYNYTVFTEPLGAYSGGSDYTLGFCVIYNSLAYKCIQASGSGSNAPTGTASDNTWWQYLTDIPDLVYNLSFKKWTSDTARGFTLYTHDGRLVHEDSTAGKKRRWLGEVRLRSDSGAKFTWSDNLKYIWNKYNQKRQFVKASNSEPAGYWTYATATWRESHAGSYQSRGRFIVGEACSGLFTVFESLGMDAAGGSARCGVSLDSTSSYVQYGAMVGVNITGATTAAEPAAISLGYHYITTVEYSVYGTNTYYNDLSGTVSLEM